MFDEQEDVKIEQGSVEIYQQQEKAVIDMQIATARQYPRSIHRSVSNAIATVTLDRETAQTCNYSLPRGGKTISGPSVHLAKILAQTWGNMRVEAKVVSVDNANLTSQAVAFDLENNLAIKVEVKRSIMTKKGRMADDMITVTGNAANAIALRNAILSVIPKAVVDKVYNEAKNFITGDLSDEAKLVKKRKAVLDGFEKTYGVKEDQILSLLGKKEAINIDKDDIVTLIGLGQALKDGDTTVDQAFGLNIKPNKGDEELIRMREFIEKASSEDDLEMISNSYGGELPAELMDLYTEKLKSFKTK
jgi:hypothetical protein